MILQILFFFNFVGFDLIHSLTLQTPKDWDLFLHLGHANPFVRVPHFLQVMFIPTMSWGGVLVAFIIKIATTRIPTTIAISIRTIHLITENMHKEIYKILSNICKNVCGYYSIWWPNLGVMGLPYHLILRSPHFSPTFYMKIDKLTT